MSAIVIAKIVVVTGPSPVVGELGQVRPRTSENAANFPLSLISMSSLLAIRLADE